ncbi:hypothetical protein PHJA_001322900 [Phtheirospermum japonicum]|uniref:Uncharacterized protein n=1 Tax=Phtheirospermum japonicum TaxID=374723 RepID=A0A830BYV6_9LAMI|nr:hypothetical protein PHJA_001322900 [Phtheirospermum japonicum]
MAPTIMAEVRALGFKVSTNEQVNWFKVLNRLPIVATHYVDFEYMVMSRIKEDVITFWGVLGWENFMRNQWLT